MGYKKHAIHPVAHAHSKGEGSMTQKVFVDHRTQLKNEQSTAGFRLKGELEEAIRAGVRYILERQLVNGCWVDWELPPGPCLMWTTAYIGCKLSGLPENLPEETFPARRRAAQWLLVNELPGHGWGYNETVGADADSTAHAILFLSSMGTRLSEGSYRRLQAFQSEDGGFSTYRRGDGYGSWCVSHPDVTPLALLALMTGKHPQQSRAINRGIDYIIEQRTESGLWNSFWWETPLYGTNACLALLSAAGRMKSGGSIRGNLGESLESLLLSAPGNAFETALLLSALVQLAAGAEAPLALSRASALARQLISMQRPDGSWNTVPILRVTRRDCYEPWNRLDGGGAGEAGTLYADQNRLFTSASIVDALARLWASQEAEKP